MKKLIKNNRGFSLVELIVVIAIMVILIAMLVPNLLGYIESARRATLKADAKQIYVATQSALLDIQSKQPGLLGKECKYQYTNSYGINKKVGRVTNFTFAYSQSDNGINNAGDSSDIDKAVAYNVLSTLGWSDSKSSRYPFKWQYNPMGKTVKEYESDTRNKGKQPGFVVVYNSDATLEYIEWGEDGYLVHVDSSGSNITITENGRFIQVGSV